MPEYMLVATIVSDVRGGPIAQIAGGGGGGGGGVQKIYPDVL